MKHYGVSLENCSVVQRHRSINQSAEDKMNGDERRRSGLW